MNEKLLLTADMVTSNKILNPFKHQLEFTTTYDKFRTAVFTVIIMPVRIIVICVLLVSAWCLACVGLYGLTEEDLMKCPIRGWRKVIREWICVLGRWAYYAGGMHISVKGIQASRSEAPILVIAPHSTFLDAAIVYVAGFPSIIVRRESGRNPWLGKILNYTQPVYVGREDRDSRQKTIQDIIDRTTSKNDWPQVLIFPEGTCTNRSCLITFKAGAFYPAVPVQPVLIRYPNKVDTVTWTWDGPGAWKLLWFTLTRAHTHCEIEFLPVYTPNDDEKRDPKLYAHNVRNVMAKALGVPTSEYSYEDCRIVKKAKDLELPEQSPLIVTQKLRSRLGLNRTRLEDKWIENRSETFKNNDKSKFISKSEFASILGIQETEPNLENLFQLYSEEKNDTCMVNWQNYLLAVHLANRATNKNNLVRLAFNFFDGHVNRAEFRYIMRLIYSISDGHSEQIFDDIVHKGHTISYDEYLSHMRMFPETISENNNKETSEFEDKKRN